MYYILNETNQIIAADESLLNVCGLSHIDELSLKIALGEIKFDPISETDLTITTDNNDKRYSMSKAPLSSMLGRLTLVTVHEIEAVDVESNVVMDLDSDLLSVEPDIEDIVKEPEVLKEDNELFDLVLEEKEEESIEQVENSIDLLSQDTEILDLGLDEKRETVADDNTPIVIDIDKIAEQIGVSHQDYDTFLNEYIDTALGLELDLQSSDEQKRSNAVATLSHLSDVLQLPVIGERLNDVAKASSDTQRETVESLYGAISRLTTSPAPVLEENDNVDFKEVIEEIPETTTGKGFGTLDLDGIKPIHFDFRLEEAADDLSLPVELIEEFVHDFIEQAHEETKNMLKAYEEGDLEKIQKIGHLLKGASSNLRIKDLSDTLYKIQFCEDSNDLEQLIKDYWGHFLSFEIQINALAK